MYFIYHNFTGNMALSQPWDRLRLMLPGLENVLRPSRHHVTLLYSYAVIAVRTVELVCLISTNLAIFPAGIREALRAPFSRWCKMAGYEGCLFDTFSMRQKLQCVIT